MTCHMVSTTWKQREMHAAAKFTFSLFLSLFLSSLVPLIHETMLPTFYVNLPFSAKTFGKQPQRYPNLSFDGDTITIK